MKIIISNDSGVPIYEQIKNQIKAQIISGDLKEDESLPGMRTLASDLKVSVITTKRAYNDLEQEGYIYSMTGKGSFVKRLNGEMVRENAITEIERHFYDAMTVAKMAGIKLDELQEILKTLDEVGEL
ncbi:MULTISPECIES: GntR family transcriptional regulator [Peptoniphilus]|uniref:GntR family transcriptional regulator n=1 Tax=Peptoniphilus TaxID=162289 RepID=UPI00028930D8|nr:MULTISPECIES: GntR family transcriptional regulator [Peptoniphilus]MBS6611162.1 GntR family transcriptional regulator [Peptoniphilus harei]MDU2115996.1 GntR family transcriptional regulator [Peptoniphilus lacydonensis]MDU5275504.1 GntR family transcriptional regulator [Peptoniphilus lacydonensis]MDU5377772.1 GntR family transcriptional regulator [Peptoniphilus lacydonensis]MDU5437041.1 GntR family transcriptional regulator [Peptoniphilus lacydonensis]